MEAWAEWLFYYTVYSFGGWLLENGYSRATTGVFWKEGFLFSPLKPMYGLAMTAMAAVRAEGGSLPFLVFCSLAIPSGIEFASGFLLDKGVGRRYWDYRGMRGNVEGYVCLAFSLCWIPLSLGCLYGLHPYVSALYRGISSGWEAAVPWIAALMLLEAAAVTVKLRMKNRWQRDLEGYTDAYGDEGSPEGNLG